ncbi:MAG: acetyl-CoA C-acyltransferase [Alphaproteobacteria bacterium]|nr:acetyl-CoA C-acyltransferase [Alphaproteobacteria bacterium]|tara:strand:- start:817 stop:1722 length:906 start_codon:yes stop_codon:yes gene_type:complete
MDMFCASSMEAIAFADALSARNPNDVYIVTGVQSMSQVEMGGFNPMFSEDVLNSNPANFLSMGNTAENLVEIYGITRKEQDEFAVASHRKMAEAQSKRHFDNETVPISGVNEDDGVRADSTVKAAGKLGGAFRNGGSVTAANSSQVTDGASAVMVTSAAFAEENNLPVKAVILSTGETGLAPMVMGLGPVEASNEALKKANLTMEDIDVIEVNEAFAAQVLACVKEWDKQGVKIDMDKVNVDGGAIAIGHPFGATGARMVGHLSEILNRENKRFGLATLCIGGGQGKAMVIENPNYKEPSL